MSVRSLMGKASGGGQRPRRRRWPHFRHRWEDAERIGRIRVQLCAICHKSRVRID
ncbi:hypothetical protein [Acrocarpospora catenulata]|uniref:hypothetical protein n=1 Tax=Acrocarpospora catenulata TaxID=2836182 RepID=UPI001BD946D4|nr:hypothetical protein [Acrocarpospora catenulata]